MSHRLQAQALQPVYPLGAQVTRPKGAQCGRRVPKKAADCRPGLRPSEERHAAPWKPKAEAAQEVDKPRVQSACNNCACPATAGPSASELRLAADQTLISMMRGTSRWVHKRVRVASIPRAAWPVTPWRESSMYHNLLLYTVVKALVKPSSVKAQASREGTVYIR